MKVSDLLRFRRRSLTRRLAGPMGLVTALLALGLAVVLVLVGGPALADGDQDELAIRDGAFWFSTLLALLYSYTTFEVFFRAADAKAVAAMPIPPGTRYWDLFIRAVVLHLPLLLLPLAHAYGLVRAGQGQGALFSATYGAAMFIFGLPLAITIHLWAGKSLLVRGQSGPASPSDLRKMLAGAAVSSDAAVLVYAPALALMVILVLGIFLDLTLRDAILRGKTQVLAPALLGVAAVALLSVRTGYRLAQQSLLQILPRFSEVDVPPPYREDGIRRKVPGESMASVLPTAAIPYFLCDIRQLRRRYRLDRILLVLFAAYLFKLVHELPDDKSALGTALIALVVMNGALVVSAFRLVGELAAPALERSLPLDPRMHRLGRLWACAIHPLMATGLATLIVSTRGDLVGALAVLGLGLVVTAVTVVLPVLLSSWAVIESRRAAWLASLWRLSVLTAALSLSGAT